jgi:hypothetical protein
MSAEHRVQLSLSELWSCTTRWDTIPALAPSSCGRACVLIEYRKRSCSGREAEKSRTARRFCSRMQAMAREGLARGCRFAPHRLGRVTPCWQLPSPPRAHPPSRCSRRHLFGPEASMSSDARRLVRFVKKITNSRLIAASPSPGLHRPSLYGHRRPSTPPDGRGTPPLRPRTAHRHRGHSTGPPWGWRCCNDHEPDRRPDASSRRAGGRAREPRHLVRRREERTLPRARAPGRARGRLAPVRQRA